jgi:hypothetical protein
MSEENKAMVRRLVEGMPPPWLEKGTLGSIAPPQRGRAAKWKKLPVDWRTFYVSTAQESTV